MTTPDPGLRYPDNADYRPRANNPSAEWHLTYACDLDCAGCNRASFLRTPHTANMTLDDAREFLRQCDEIGFNPRIVIIGGEPTMHGDFDAFVALATEWMTTHPARTGPNGEWPRETVPQIWSNAYSPKSRRLLQIATARHGASVNPDTHKPEGSVTKFTGANGWVDDIYVSPSDFGEPLRLPCYQHCSIHCGISVDHEGYSPCAMGGAIDAVLGLGVRTKRLADLFDREKMAELTARLCAHCGHQRGKRENVDACETRFNTPMSPTWIKAFEGRS